LAVHPLGLLPRFLRAAAGTANLAALATAADQHLDPATRTQEQPGRAFRQIGLDRAWIASAASGILTRHACSAPWKGLSLSLRQSPLGNLLPRPKLRLGKQLRHLSADPGSRSHSFSDRAHTAYSRAVQSRSRRLA
jgi:hypothetical protein